MGRNETLHGDFLAGFRRLPDRIYDVVQLYGCVERGMSALARADCMRNVVIHLAYDVGRSFGHAVRDKNEFGRYVQRLQ